MAAAPANVRFVGQLPREQVGSWYQAADVFVSTARQETLGLVVLEAAAAGPPLVLRDIGGRPLTEQREAGHCRVRNTARASARTSGASSAM